MVSRLCSSLFILDELFDIQRDIRMKYKLSSNEFSERLMKHYSSNICHILYSLFDDKFFLLICGLIAGYQIFNEFADIKSVILSISIKKSLCFSTLQKHKRNGSSYALAKTSLII